MLYPTIKLYLQKLIRPKGKYAFLMSLPSKSRVMDIGCGFTPNRMPKISNIEYHGYDIFDHGVNPETLDISAYVVIPDVNKFWSTIGSLSDSFDAVISSHNLEHTEDRLGALLATAEAVKSGGKLYLSFPSTRSMLLPRGGEFNLNYFDDPTHRALPPDLSLVVNTLTGLGFEFEFVAETYRPSLARFIGWVICNLNLTQFLGKKGMYFAIAFYGFETVIVANRK